ncbi:MAG: O-antigen ligase family protein [Elusimicrobia bacterium]|nr:O-antigen ligase family protein [Elusimicrobiota bacterium]
MGSRSGRLAGPGLPLLAAAAAVPLAFGPWCQDVYGIVRMLAASWLLAAAALVRAARPEAPGRADAPDGAAALWPPLGVLAAAAILSAAVCEDPWMGWIGGHGFYGFSILGWSLCGLAFFLSGAVSSPEFSRRLARWVAAGSVPVSAYALFQWGWQDILTGFPVERPYSSLGGSLHLGSYLMLAAPLAWASATEAEAPAWGRAAGWTALVLGLPALAATGSRSSWLGALAGIGGCAWLRWGRSRLWKTGLVVLAAAALLVGLNKAFSELSPARRFAEPAPALDELHMESDVVRLEIWRCAARAFLDHPWLGVGTNDFASAYRRYKRPVHATSAEKDSSDAHNDWLQVMATLGLAGAAAYLWLHWQAVTMWLRLFREGRLDGPRAAMTGSLLGFLLQTKLNAMPWSSLFVVGLLAGCLFGRLGEGGALRPRRAAVRGAAAAALVLAACCSWLAWADHLEIRGLLARGAGRPREAAALLERAVRWNPWETAYRLNLDNLLWDAAASVPLEPRRELLRRAVAVAADGVRRRPSDATAYYLLGQAELRRCRWGGEGRLDAARLALAAARALAPHSRMIREDLERVIALRRRP